MAANREELWILVADGEHARILVPLATEGHFTTKIAFDSGSAHLRAADPASVVAAGPAKGSGRHGAAPSGSPHEQAKQSFLVDVGRRINALAQRDAFERLVLVAPARALHELRAALNHQACERVSDSESKDLVKLNDHDLSPHLAQWWVPPETIP